jgi:hypothetical protein
MFLNLTKRVTSFALDVAVSTKLGGRDSLIIGAYLFNRVAEIFSHDKELLKVKKITVKHRTVRIIDPIE